MPSMEGRGMGYIFTMVIIFVPALAGMVALKKLGIAE